MRSLTRSLLLILALGAGSALAQRKVQDFQEAREMTPEEIAASKLRKSNLSSYGKDTTDKVAPIPWMAIGLCSAALLIAAPFAWRAYRDTSSDIESRRA